MKIRPALDEVRAIAAAGDYNVLPVSGEILSDICTPIEALKILKNISTHCYLLESAQPSEKWGRYTFLGLDPKMEITCRNGVMKAGELTFETQDPSQTLREILAQYKSPRFASLPTFTGGLVGYFAYDYLGYSEPKARTGAQDTENFKDVDLMLFDQVIAFDHLRQKIVLIVNMQLDAKDLETSYNKAVLRLDQLAQLLQTGTPKREASGRLLGKVTPLFDKDAYCEMVEKAKHAIHEGEIFQIVLSNRLAAPFEGSLLGAYRMLRTINPSPYMFYFSGTDVEVAGASPETLVKLEDGVLHTFPLAGTRPRGKTDEEDKALEAELLADEKELAEHDMLVDLGRNDLGRVSRFGTVEVEKLHSIERYSHVMHWTPSRRCFRQAPSPVHRKYAPASSSGSWRTASAASTAVPSATSTLPATWTPASPSASPTRKTGRYSSAAVPASWRTRCPRRNIRSASTRHKPWSARSGRHRRRAYDAAHRQLRQLFL